MGSISKDEKQITLYYNAESSLGKQINAYVNAAEKDILAIDISKTKVTAKQCTETIDLEEKDWLRLLEKSPTVLKSAIAVNGEDNVNLESAASVKKYLETDSAELKKN